MGFSLIRPGAREDFHCQLRLFHLPCRHVCTTFIPCAVLLRYLFSDVFLIVAFSAFPSYARGGFDCLPALLQISVRAIVYLWEIADHFA